MVEAQQQHVLPGDDAHQLGAEQRGAAEIEMVGGDLLCAFAELGGARVFGEAGEVDHLPRHSHFARAAGGQAPAVVQKRRAQTVVPAHEIFQRAAERLCF